MDTHSHAKSNGRFGKIAAGSAALVAVISVLTGVTFRKQPSPTAATVPAKPTISSAQDAFTAGPHQPTCLNANCFTDHIADDVQSRAAAVSHAARLLAHSYDDISEALDANPTDLLSMLPMMYELEQPFLQVQEASTDIEQDILCQMGAEQSDAGKLFNATNEVKASSARIRQSVLRAALSARRCRPHIEARARSKGTRESYAQFEQTQGDDPVKRVEMFVGNEVVRQSSQALSQFGSYVSERSMFTKSSSDMLWAEQLLEDSEEVATNEEQLAQIRMRRAESFEAHGKLFARLPSPDIQLAVQRFKLATDSFALQGHAERASASQIRLARLLAEKGFVEDALNASRRALSFDETSAPASTLRVVLLMKLGMLRTSDEVVSALQILEHATGKLTAWPEIERDRVSLEQLFRSWRIPAGVSLSISNAGSFRELGMACAGLQDSARFFLCLLCKVAFPN